MATTTNTVFPINSAGRSGDGGSASMVTIPCDPTELFKAGDVVTIDATTQDAITDNTPTTGIFGVVAGPGTDFTAATTIDRDGAINEHTVNIWLAEPGSRFSGNMVTTASTDEVGVYGDNVRVSAILVLADTDGVMALGVTGTAVTFTMEYVSPQYDVENTKWVYGREAGVGVTNPRLNFVFLNSDTVFA